MGTPGYPGIAPTWTSSTKDAVGTPLGTSRVWFTLGYGILNEVSLPCIDSVQIRDPGFTVADDRGFWSDVKCESDYTIDSPALGVRAYTVVHRPTLIWSRYQGQTPTNLWLTSRVTQRTPASRSANTSLPPSTGPPTTNTLLTHPHPRQ